MLIEETVDSSRISPADVHVQYNYHAATINLAGSFHNSYIRYIVDAVGKPNAQTVNLLGLYSFSCQFFYKFVGFQLLVAVKFRVIREKRKTAFLIFKIRNRVRFSILFASAD